MAATHHEGRALPCGLLMAAGGLVIAGCAGTPHVGADPRAAAGPTRHVALALGETRTGGTPLTQPAPVYPPALLDRRLPPRDIQANLAVNEQGKVFAVRVEDDDPSDPQSRLFDEAVRAAALRWIFEPLRVAHWAADADGNTHDVGDEERPFSMDYVFHFGWKDGKPVTDASASARNPK